MNKLCETKHPAPTTGYPATKELLREIVIFGDHTFNLIDTPSTDSSKETYKHAYLLKCAYEAMPYNAIFLVLTYNTRKYRICQYIKEQTKFIKKYMDNVVLMFSACDVIKKDERGKAEKNIAKIVRKNGIKQAIMYSYKSSSTDLSNAMYDCMSRNFKIEIKVTDEEFFTKFNVWSVKEDLYKAYDDFKNKAKNMLNDCVQMVEDSQKESGMDMNDLIQAAAINLTNELDSIIDEFEKKHNLTIIDFNSYTAHIEIKKLKIKIVDEFFENVENIWNHAKAQETKKQVEEISKKVNPLTIVEEFKMNENGFKSKKESYEKTIDTVMKAEKEVVKK